MKFRAWLKNFGIKTVEGSILAIIGIILAALFKGEPLKGFTATGSFMRVLKSEVPLWWLALAIIIGVSASSAFLWSWRGRGRSITGLAHFRPRFNGYDYEPSMDSLDLLIVFNDGKSWIPNHREALERRVLTRGQRVRVLVIHPRSEFLSTLVRKTNRSIPEEITYLHQTFKHLENLKIQRPNLVEVRGHHLFNPYVLHLTESVAIVHPFFLLERGELPLLVLKKTEGNSLYEQYRADAEKVWAEAVSLKEEDFTFADKGFLQSEPNPKRKRKVLSSSQEKSEI
jgi:hypothetical protein